MNTFYHEHILPWTHFKYNVFVIYHLEADYDVFWHKPIRLIYQLVLPLKLLFIFFSNVMNVFINTTDWNKTEKYVFSIKNVQNDSKKGNYFFFNFSLLFLDYVNTITYTFFTVVKFSEFTRLTIKEETSDTTVRNLFSLCSFTLDFLQLYCWSFILCA